MNESRIYKPGTRRDTPAPPESARPASGQPDGDAGQHGEDSPQPFPIDCLPPVAAEMARAIARTERTPETLAGCCILGFLSVSVGAGLQVKSGPKRITRGNLYIGASAESGSGKSETIRHAQEPLIEYAGELMDDWKRHTLPKAEADHEMLEAEIAGLRKQAAGKNVGAAEREEIRADIEKKKARLRDLAAELQAPVLFVEDITGERMAVLLANRGECLASISPDAGAIVNILLGRYNKLDRTDEGIYLKAFSGDFCRVDRQGREPVVLNHPCLAVLWLTQPDKLDALLKQRSLTDGGLIPRILSCHTRAEPRPITEDASEIPPLTAQGWAQLVRGLLHNFRLAGQPATITPTTEAQHALDEHYNGIVARRKHELRDVGPYAARWNEQAWRIAVCLHAGLYGAEAGRHGLELETALSAIKLADWFAAQQLEILAGSRMAARRAKLDEVLALLADNPQGIRASDVYRKRIVPTADEAHALLERMEAEGELQGREEKPDGGGHITRLYTKARK
jgi:hypothetical protein